MLREFQEEIARLKAELAGGTPSTQAVPEAPEQLVQRVVERQVSPEEVQAMREQMEQEMQQEAVEQGELLHAETIARVSVVRALLWHVMLSSQGRQHDGGLCDGAVWEWMLQKAMQQVGRLHVEIVCCQWEQASRHRERAAQCHCMWQAFV